MERAPVLYWFKAFFRGEVMRLVQNGPQVLNFGGRLSALEPEIFSCFTLKFSDQPL
ncbi:uncharacterized protein H6S33_011072 [Morchella sextelata]|uniref:uncharacterized protein n=1 Tax=Morchella sextelata TaxID=1174677 RepID=UPI001D050FDC|nr:uncharacterized protein H6S33_011072 [Morchella sextelata]KAH0611807.1 hypothetical protein H6S33_011072 [Morchella sextelata]